MKITYLIETARSLECMSHLVFKLAVYTDTRCHLSYSVRNSSRSCATVHIRAIEFQRWPVAINKVARRASYFTWLSLSLSRNCEILWKFSISPSSPIDIFDTRNTRHWYSSMDRALLSRIGAYCSAPSTLRLKEREKIVSIVPFSHRILFFLSIISLSNNGKDLKQHSHSIRFETFDVGHK